MESDVLGVPFVRVQVVAAVLETVRVDVSVNVLWAVAQWLDYENAVRSSSSFSWGGRAERLSAPLRELARSALVRALKVDHGFDKAAWRRALLVERELRSKKK
jgi:hypothetical protein